MLTLKSTSVALIVVISVLAGEFSSTDTPAWRKLTLVAFTLLLVDSFAHSPVVYDTGKVGALSLTSVTVIVTEVVPVLLVGVPLSIATTRRM